LSGAKETACVGAKETAPVPFAKLKAAADGVLWMTMGMAMALGVGIGISGWYMMMMMPSQTQSGKSISFHFDCMQIFAGGVIRWRVRKRGAMRSACCMQIKCNTCCPSTQPPLSFQCRHGEKFSSVFHVFMKIIQKKQYKIRSISFKPIKNYN